MRGVTVVVLVSLLGGGLAGSVFTWYMTRTEPTLVTYNVTTTAVRADRAVRSVVPDLKIQVGREEITALYTHNVEFSVPRGPYVDSAEVAVTFRGGHVLWDEFLRRTPSEVFRGSEVRIFGMTAEAPSPVHKIECNRLKDGARCAMGPLSARTQGNFSVILATNQSQKPSVVMTGKGVEFIKSEEFLAREARSLRGIFSQAAPYIGALVGFLLGVIVEIGQRLWRRRRSTS